MRLTPPKTHSGEEIVLQRESKYLGLEEREKMMDIAGNKHCISFLCFLMRSATIRNISSGIAPRYRHWT